MTHGQTGGKIYNPEEGNFIRTRRKRRETGQENSACKNISYKESVRKKNIARGY